MLLMDSIPFCRTEAVRQIPVLPHAVPSQRCKKEQHLWPALQAFHPARGRQMAGMVPAAPCTLLGPAASLQGPQRGESVTAEPGWAPGWHAAGSAKHKPIHVGRDRSPV